MTDHSPARRSPSNRVPSRSDDAGLGRLRASWLRSERYGVSADAVEPVFAGTEPEESLFHRCGTEVLVDLQRSMESEPVGMMLTDAGGVVLSRVSGDHSLLRALDAVHLAPGFGYSEREVGTNGLGLALADLAPTMVRADEHYSLSLTGFTCAAAPVVDPATGHLEGAVNLTTWSRTSSNLLLTLARSAASTISSSMLARGSGHQARPASRRSLFRFDDSACGVELGPEWTKAVATAAATMAAGGVVAAIGRPSTGRATLLAHAARRAFPRHRILSAAAPDSADVAAWLDLWSFEAGRTDTVVVLRDADALPAYAAEHLGSLLFSPGHAMPVALTAEAYQDVPTPLATAVTSVVALTPLRERPDDILPLARYLANSIRGRDVDFSAGAERALRNHDWPHDAAELTRVITRAVNRSDVVDTHVLPAHVLATPSRRLSSIEAFEHGEIVRVLSSGTLTMRQAAEHLGMSRATLYRKIAYYKIDVNRP